MKKNQKLLILINDLSFFISHRLQIAETALGKGFEVIIGYGELGGADFKFLENIGFKLYFIPMDRSGMNLKFEIKTIYYIWKFFKEQKPDIVHLITIKPYIYGGIISRLIQIPSLVSAISGLGTIFTSNNLKNRLIKFSLFPLFKFALNNYNQKIILQNKSDLKLLVDWGVLNTKKVELIKGSGVNLNKFKYVEDEPKGTPVITFAARLLRDKGVYEFITAAKLIFEKGISGRFLLAGKIDSKNPTGLTLEELNHIKKSHPYIEYLGHHNDIASLYARSNIICLPSYREGLPKSLIEAAAAGRAVITSNVPGCRDAIIPDKTGLLVQVKNSLDLALAIERLIKNPTERMRMGKHGRLLAINEFSIEKVIDSHLKIYEDLLSNFYCNFKK